MINMRKMHFKSLSILPLLTAVLLMGSVMPVYADGDFNPNPPADPQYHYYYPLTVSVSPEGAGSASGAGKYEAGKTVWLNTSANVGYVFSHWEKNGVFFSDQRSLSFTMLEERPSFVAVYEYKPAAPTDPQNNYEPKKRLYLTCDQAGCSFNLTSGEKRVIGKWITVQAYLDAGYTVLGWYEGDSLIATTTGFSYMMPDHDVTLRVEIEYNPMTPGDPASAGGDIALEADNLDDIDPFVANSLFYFERTEYTYTGRPLSLGYFSRLNPEVVPLDDLGTEVGSYTTRVDVTIKNDSIDTHKVFTLDYTIVPANLEVSVGNYVKTYGAENPEFTLSYKGFVNGETTTVLTSMPQITTTAGKQSIVGEYAIEVSGGTAKNYNIQGKNGKLTVRKAPIVITPNDVEIEYGDDLTGYVYGYKVDGFMNGDTVSCFTANPVVSLQGDGINVGNYTLTATGAAADNYSITYGEGTLTVKKAPMTLTVNNASRIYGAENPQFSFTAVDKAGQNKVSELTVQPTLSTTATVLSGVGEYAITATGAESNNYVITAVDGALTVGKAPLSIKPKDVLVEYGTDMTGYAYDFVYEGFVNGDYTSSLTAMPAVTIENYKTDVGTYNLVASGAQAANYEISYTNGTLTIAQAVLTITISDTAKVYGQPNPDFSYVVKDSKGNDCLAELSVLPTIATIATAASGVGVYDITATGAQSQNYSISVIDGHLTIRKAPLKITPKDMMMGYGTDVKTLIPEFWFEGFVNGDTASCLAAQPVIAVAQAITSIGVYDITCSGAQAVNYDITYGVGKLTVDKLVLTLEAKSVSREYGDDNPTFEYILKDTTGAVVNATIAYTPSFSCSADKTSGVGEYDIVVSLVYDTQNCSITTVNGKLTVTPATLTVTAIDASYDEGTAVFDLIYAIDGFKNNDDESVLTKLPVIECSADANSPHGTYVITVSGAEAANYVFVYVNGTLKLLETAVPAVVFDDVAPVYDLTGRMVGTTADELNPGIYIIRGKKVVITEYGW